MRSQCGLYTRMLSIFFCIRREVSGGEREMRGVGGERTENGLDSIRVVLEGADIALVVAPDPVC